MSLLDRVIEAIPNLYVIEQKVFKMHLGLDDGCPLDLSEAGLVLNLAEAQIRNIEDKVLGRLGIVIPKRYKRMRLHRRYLQDYLKDLEAFNAEAEND